MQNKAKISSSFRLNRTHVSGRHGRLLNHQGNDSLEPGFDFQKQRGIKMDISDKYELSPHRGIFEEPANMP